MFTAFFPQHNMVVGLERENTVKRFDWFDREFVWERESVCVFVCVCVWVLIDLFQLKSEGWFSSVAVVNVDNSKSICLEFVFFFTSAF